MEIDVFVNIYARFFPLGAGGQGVRNPTTGKREKGRWCSAYE